MYIINSIILTNFFIFYKNMLITNFLKTILIKKISSIKNNKKKIINHIKKNIYIYKKIFFSFFLKKTKFGYYINKEKLLFLSKNLISYKKYLFPNRIFNFEFIFKTLFLEKNIIATRKLNFKKKIKIINIKNNNFYLGIIKNVVNYGIFIDIGKIDGLLHISDIPNIKSIYKNLFVKNIIKVQIIKFDKKLKKISLNLKKSYKKIKFNCINNNNCKIKKKRNNIFICYDKKHCVYHLFNLKQNFKKNDIIKGNIIKFLENPIISLNHKIIKLNKNQLKIKFKFNNYFMYYFNKNKIISNYLINFTKINNINYYKYYLFNIINNDFKKIIYFKNKILIKNNKIYIKINFYENFFIIKNFYLKKNKIYFFVRNY